MLDTAKKISVFWFNMIHLLIWLRFLAPNRGLGAQRGLLKRVDCLDPKSDQKKFRQGLALKR